MKTIGEDIVKWVHRLLLDMGVHSSAADWLDRTIIVATIVVLALLAGFILNYALVGAIQRIVKHTKAKWDDLLFESKLLRKLFSVVPAFMVYVLLPLAFAHDSWWLHFLRKGCVLVIVWLVLMFLNTFIKNAFNFIESKEEYRDRPMRGLSQILQITLFFIGCVVIISIIIEKSPWNIFAGVGASAAVLMLIFKDSILGFVSGVQLSANNMLRPGDWISMPKYGADGTVIEVTLNTVKVRNFDNTITMIPPYALTSDSFQNWRGMEESPGRRVKRSINIDMNSVKFCNSEMLDKYKTIGILKAYIEETQRNVEAMNAQLGIDDPFSVNSLRQTNIGVFRRYLDFYLQNLPTVNHNMTCMVRQLQPTENGIPIELYFFSAIKEWVGYERVQADVFDHLLGIIPFFGLNVFQNPSGADFRRISSPAAGAAAANCQGK